MTTRKILKITGLSIAGTFVLLLIVLVVHIATAKPKVYDNAHLQISRIDFNRPLDSAAAKKIHRNLRSIAGVRNGHFNLQKGVLVYFHDNRITDSEKVFNALMSKGNYKATRFVVPKELASKQVCPVMDQNSFGYKFSRGIQRIFN